jgi:hypothetical protein
LSNVKKGRQPDGATSLSIIEAGEQISARIGDALLGLFLGRSCRLGWELKHRCFLTVESIVNKTMLCDGQEIQAHHGAPAAVPC